MTARQLAPRRWWLIHLTTWTFSLALYLLFIYPLTRILALDYEALLFNLAEGLPARVDQGELTRGVLFILIGPAPFCLLLLAWPLYRLGARRGWGRDPLRQSPWWIRIPVALTTLGALAAFSLPGSRALSVWFTAEVFWWVQWVNNIRPILDEVRHWTPRLLIPTLLLAAAGALYHMMRRPPRGRPGRWLRCASDLTTIILASAVLLSCGVHGQRVFMLPGRWQFEEKCDGCHARTRPLFIVKSPAEWPLTISRTHDQEELKLTEGDATKITGFLQGMRSFSDSWTFRSRCQRCHLGGSWGWERRPKKEWARISERLSRWSPYYYRRPAREQVTAHLSSTLGDEEAMFDLPRQRFEAYRRLDKVCGVCHSLTWGADRARAMSPAETAALVRRMVDKNAPGWTDAQVKDLSATYRQLLADPKTVRRMFPHDLPARGGGLPW